MSEIDDIFAFKAKTKKTKAAPPLPPSKPVPSSSKSSKKKKRSAQENDNTLESIDAGPSFSKKRPVPETVVDTSDILIAPSSKRHKSDDKEKIVKAAKKNADVDLTFKDSRGTGNRHTTEEGWTIYKEDELGISNEGGGKLLCVSFFTVAAASNQTHHYVHLTVNVVFD